MIRDQVTAAASALGVAAACRALGVPRSTLYRQTGGQADTPATVTAQAAHAQAAAPSPNHEAPPPAPATRRRRSSRALSDAEVTAVLAVLNSARFVDQAPREIYATLLDEGQYLCSWPTMYRLLRAQGQAQRRRDHPRRSLYTKPELLATGPRQVWCWDITKLKGPHTWTYFYLYVIIDIYSRAIVGWMVAMRESAELAEQLIAETCAKEQIGRGQLTIHADRGAPMTAKTLAQLLSDLGVAKSHSRPSVSDDNPYAESQFKTLKYHPDYPARFGCIEDARAWMRGFVTWYNQQHHHTGLGLLTPAVVHSGQAAVVRAARQQVLTAAYQQHPERFVRGQPVPPRLPEAVWINPPATTPQAAAAGDVHDSEAPATMGQLAPVGEDTGALTWIAPPPDG